MNASIQTTRRGLVLLSALTFAACSGGTAGDPANRGPFTLSLGSTGHGQIFPYQIAVPDPAGFPTTTIINIDSDQVLKANVTPNNGVLPVKEWPTTATLPDGNPGNHFLMLRFSHKLEPTSILSNLLANQANSGLTTSISLLEYDPSTEATQVIKGRGFVGGKSYVSRGGQLVLLQVVEEQNGAVVVLEPEGQGFPLGFSGAVDLVSEKTFTFVADTNGDLRAPFETFPTGKLLRIIVTNAVRDSENKILEHEVCTATTVGPDLNAPDVLGRPSGGQLRITPGNNAANVDPTTAILVEFNKPVQPADMGTFLDPTNLVPGTGGVTISVTAAAKTFSIIYYADPVDWGDLCNYVITPAYNLPGSPASSGPNVTTVNFTVNATNVRGLGGLNLGANAVTAFTTGIGPGLVNAPVAPEAIYVGLGGSAPGLSVIDLNGFGQGTGDNSIPGVTERFSLNPNIGQVNVDPPLAPGTSNVDAGSAGVFTLAQDTNGKTRLLSDPLVGTIGDIHVGNPLDVIFNNFNINRNSNTSNQVNPATGFNNPGNTITTAPHPNPPRLVFPPPNPARAIFAEEPTRTSSSGPAGAIVVGVPPCAVSPVNLLNVGNPEVPASNPAGLGIFNAFSPGVFYGPQPPPPSPPPTLALCPFTARQQIGHFLYVLDRDNRSILVVNSNRMTVLDTIKLSDPFDMAMAPNLRTLAVSNFSSGRVSFIDIDPFSPSFHTVVAETRVNNGPTSIAWQPDGEVLMVVSPGANTATLLSGLDFSVIKSVSGFLSRPLDVVLTERYQTTGWLSGVYFAYILNANGTIAIYESGPDGVNGIGFNDIIGIVPNASFPRAKKLLHDPTSSVGAVLVAHVDTDGLAQVSRLELSSSPAGQQPINQNQGGFIVPPTFRQKEWTVVQTFGGRNPTAPTKDQFSGDSIVDMAMDEIYNFGALPSFPTAFNGNIPNPPTSHSGKDTVKVQAGGPVVAYIPQFLFVGLADSGMVDVMELNSGKRRRSIPAASVSAVASYWRQ